MAQKQQGSVAAGVTVAVMLILVLSALGYYQFVYAPTIPTSTTTSSAPTNLKTVLVNITLNAASACGGPSATQTSQPSSCDAYSPNPVKLVLGVNNSVIFDNVDSAVHTATANDNSFDTGILNGGQQSNTIIIDKPGQYPYFCTVHPWMKGELVVVQASGASSLSGATSTTSASTSSSTFSSSQAVGSKTSSSGSGVKASILNGAGTNQSSPGFSPGRIKLVIGVNNTVTWTNDDSSPHTVTATDKTFDSGNLNAEQSFTYTFNTPGTFNYICLYHSWMKGTVVVVTG